MGGLAQVRIEVYIPEEEETEEVEDNVSPVSLFEEQFPPSSKIFVEWINNNTANLGIFLMSRWRAVVQQFERLRSRS
ncbi:MAG: hypothetical protein IPI04_16705 [Ignavibacteria bacterium]|nr:hypothetical protein [Ignavibacteria bacterium]